MSELKLEAHEISWIIEEKIRNGPYSHLIPEKFKPRNLSESEIEALRKNKGETQDAVKAMLNDLGPWPWPKSPEVKKKEKKK